MILRKLDPERVIQLTDQELLNNPQLKAVFTPQELEDLAARVILAMQSPQNLAP